MVGESPVRGNTWILRGQARNASALFLAAVSLATLCCTPRRPVRSLVGDEAVPPSTSEGGKEGRTSSRSESPPAKDPSTEAKTGTTGADVVDTDGLRSPPKTTGSAGLSHDGARDLRASCESGAADACFTHGMNERRAGRLTAAMDFLTRACTRQRLGNALGMCRNEAYAGNPYGCYNAAKLKEFEGRRAEAVALYRCACEKNYAPACGETPATSR